MKSKPPAKKAKLEMPSSSSSTTSGSSTPQATDGKPKPKILNAIKGLASKAAGTAGTSTSSEVGNTKSKASSVTAGPSSPFRLSFPILPSPEIPKDFIRIGSVASIKPEPAGASGSVSVPPIEEVETLQHELETLWSILAVRSRTIKTESDVFESLLIGQGQSDLASATVTSILGDSQCQYDQEKLNTVKSIIDSGHGTRTSVSAAAKLVLGTESPKAIVIPSITPAIVVGSNRKSNNSAAAATSGSVPSPVSSSRQPKKKLKAELGDKSKVGLNKPPRVGQNRSHSVSMDESFLRLEAPNQFWEFADSYCRDISDEDVQMLTNEITEFRDIPDTTFSVPPLGKHFSGIENKNVDTGASRSREDRDKGRDVVGPLTQRLVTALVEDRISQYNLNTNNGTRDDLNGGGSEFHLIPRPGLVKALGLDVNGPGPQVPLEARLKMVLAEQGYLLGDEGDDPMNPDQGDEVLAEIKRTFSTLRKLHKHNLDKFEKLQNSAKTELNRLPPKKELEKADKEIIAAYRAITACRIKRKPVTQKERSVATKALQYRQHALEKLTNVTSSTATSGSN